MISPQLFPDIFRTRGANHADKVACRFFKGPSLVPQILTFGELWAQAAGLAAVLRSQGLSGQRALLLCKSQQQFVIAFYACLLSGTVAVPASPPKRRNLIERLQLIVRDARAAAVIFDIDEIGEADLRADGEALLNIDVRAFSSEELTALGREFRPSAFDDSAPAFLQYTSGSTGDPKGVVVSHGNLVRNCAVIAEAMELSEDSSLFTALPLFHDMGLVGGVLQLMYSGCVAGFLSPAEFVQYPERWLQILSKFQVTVSGGPNFMYDLAARAIRPEDIAGVDLSSWRVAFCGAEPIRAATVARFVRQFGSVGFRAEAFFPCYGMAESTLFITGVYVGNATSVRRREGGDIVGCGVPRGDTRIAIVDPLTFERSPDGESGEIWVAGGSVAQGYWMRPDISAQTFQARIAGGDGSDYLRTGDLGFVADGELYVAGRLKDLIIVNGKKHSPQDIEDECERCHEALRQAGGAAFDVRDGDSERLVLVFELKREWLRRHGEWPQIRSAMRDHVDAAFGIGVSDIVLIKPGALPRTSSGKVRRSQCRTDYLAGALERADAEVAA
jgi:acyl-CoA synthetase (AMP-forming)/AMP-acid ligase II